MCLVPGVMTCCSVLCHAVLCCAAGGEGSSGGSGGGSSSNEGGPTNLNNNLMLGLTLMGALLLYQVRRNRLIVPSTLAASAPTVSCGFERVQHSYGLRMSSTAMIEHVQHTYDPQSLPCNTKPLCEQACGSG
jgi:hypothetical protein